MTYLYSEFDIIERALEYNTVYIIHTHDLIMSPYREIYCT